ncbi:Uu.00g095320.m01.CDS01 [Anthostomella pinea]|uniref:Uu.00g095320.m01.CDS01 n=1 Tax=Anthostomella pinea TaxID=933095 RepID=A0AAI8YMU1_9PEZI|nr:Uu.00g095320.m01.CDS01 [Anthostomella pinea]
MICRPRITTANLLSQPGIRAVLILSTLVLLYATYGYLRFYRDPLSVFFSEEHGFDRTYSKTRQAEADLFLDAAKADPASSRARLGKARSQPEMCAVFITVGRDVEGRQYIDSAVGSFLANMSRAEREAIHLKLFFADVPNPETQHKSYASLVDADVADDILTYPATLPGNVKESKMKTLMAWASDRQNKHALERKTVYDYAYALSQCVSTTNAPYIAIFEGDILLADGWAARTLKNLHTIDTMMKDPSRHEPQRGQVEPGGPNSWFYLRMFNQERSTGWSGGYGFRSNNVHIISLAVGVPLFLILLLARRFVLPRHVARHLDGWVLFLVCAIAVPLFIWLFYASGKASLLGAPRGVREEFFGCCNQALVYNRAHAQDLSDFLMAATTHDRPGRSDMLPKDFAWNHGLARISAYPMLAQHAGRVSAIDTSNDEAKRVWSMAFESFNPSQLARDHIRDVRELYGDAAALDMETRDQSMYM